MPHDGNRNHSRVAGPLTKVLLQCATRRKPRPVKGCGPVDEGLATTCHKADTATTQGESSPKTIPRSHSLTSYRPSDHPDHTLRPYLNHTNQSLVLVAMRSVCSFSSKEQTNELMRTDHTFCVLIFGVVANSFILSLVFQT